MASMGGFTPMLIGGGEYSESDGGIIIERGWSIPKSQVYLSNFIAVCAVGDRVQRNEDDEGVGRERYRDHATARWRA